MFKSFKFNAILCVIAFSLFSGMQLQAEKQDLYKIPFQTITGEDTSLTKYKGKVLLIVNVASECGRTPQYKNLQALHEKYGEKGLVILGFPANNFGKQEPGSNEDILEFCTSEYMVKFPMMSKIEVKGDKQHPLYKQLVASSSALDKKSRGEVKWNFEKFLIDRDGKMVARFRSKTLPDSPEALKAITTALDVKSAKKKVN